MPQSFNRKVSTRDNHRIKPKDKTCQCRCNGNTYNISGSFWGFISIQQLLGRLIGWYIHNCMFKNHYLVNSKRHPIKLFNPLCKECSLRPHRCTINFAIVLFLYTQIGSAAKWLSGNASALPVITRPTTTPIVQKGEYIKAAVGPNLPKPVNQAFTIIILMIRHSILQLAYLN